MATTQPATGPAQPILVSDEPFCTETPLTSLDSWVTPTELFYSRSHFPEMPSADQSSWRLDVGGAVLSPESLSYDDVRALPSVEAAVTLECAGNSRSYVAPPAEGLQFRHGAVGTAIWKGVRVADILAKADVREGAVEVLFEAADFGEEEEEGETLELSYARSLPLSKATDPGTMVVYEMNGGPLSPAHGYPLRLVVPGWYGMASVKWLSSIKVLEQPFEGFFQSRRYVHISEGETAPADQVGVIQVKSLITHPRHGEVVGPGSYTVRGFAWSGEGEVASVDVTTNGGHSWSQARLVGEMSQGAWRGWEFPWTASRPGHFILQARASDTSGNTQPPTIPWNFRGYANNSIHTIAVEVAGG